MERVRLMLKEVNSLETLMDVISDINELASDYGISFRLYRNRIEANL